MNNKGFSISEILIALAICAIVSGIAIIGVSSVRGNMNRLTASESAKEIYVASENKILEYKEYGLWNNAIDKFNSEEREVIMEKPTDFDYWFSVSGLDDEIKDDYIYGPNGNMFVLSSRDKEDSEFIFEYLLPADSISDEIIIDANFYIEINIKTASIYGVYYALGDIDYSSISSTREDSFSINEEIVGYYGGGLLSNTISKTIPEPYIKIENGEDLLLEISMEEEIDTNINVEIRGTSSDSCSKLIINNDGTYDCNVESYQMICETQDGIKSYGIILDSLTRYKDENKHFRALFPDFYAGEDVEITVYIRPTNEYLATSIIRNLETNTLYDSIDDNINIASIRHLENVDGRISGVNENLSMPRKLLFKSNISFSGEGEGVRNVKNYYEGGPICTYDNKEYEIFNPYKNSYYPVNLTRINSIEGSGYIIYDTGIFLNNYQSIGIIGECENITISDLGLIGSQASGVLSSPEISSENNINVGAFVGHANSARINSCFSTTNIDINNSNQSSVCEIYVGGFVGLVDSFAEINKSYGGGIVDVNGIYKNNIEVSIPSEEGLSVSLGGFVGGVKSDELAEFFVYDSYQTQSLSIDGATGAEPFIYEGGFIGSISFDDCNIDIDRESYIAAPMKSDITPIAQQELKDYINGEAKRRNIRFGGIIGGFRKTNGAARDSVLSNDISVYARYINYFSDFCGVPYILCNNDKPYDELITLKDAGLYYRNSYGIGTDIADLISDKIPAENTYPISSFLKGHAYSFNDPTKLNHHYGDWQTKELATMIKISKGHGIESISYGIYKYNEEYVAVKYGEEIDFSSFAFINQEGYEGWTLSEIGGGTGSSGVLINRNGKYTYIAGVGTCEFLCSAKGLAKPRLLIYGGGEFVYNYMPVELQISNTQRYANNVEITYVLLEDDKEIVAERDLIEKGNEWSLEHIVSKNEYLGTRYYCVRASVSDGILTSGISLTVPKEVILSRVKIIFNNNDIGTPPHGVVITPASYGYVEYGSSLIYKNESGPWTINPSAKRTCYTFLGWSIPEGTIYKPTDLSDINVFALWKKNRYKIITYSGGGWFYD